jgi:hypothetical protein
VVLPGAPARGYLAFGATPSEVAGPVSAVPRRTLETRLASMLG